MFSLTKKISCEHTCKTKNKKLAQISNNELLEYVQFN